MHRVSDELSPEDAKIITLARSTRARTGADEGAAVRDTTGRTYTAASIVLPSLELTALQLAVAMAVSSGADALEAAAIVTNAETTDEDDLAVVGDLSGSDTPVFVADFDGVLQRVDHT